MKISQEVRDYAAAQENAAALETSAQPIQIQTSIQSQQSGMKQMSEEFRSRGSELYHSANIRQVEIDDEQA